VHNALGRCCFIPPEPNVIKLLCPQLTSAYNKLECLSPASFSSIVKCLRVSPELTRVKRLLSDPILGRLLTLPIKRLTGMTGANTLAY
jgi:hypothetical protein